MTDLSREEKIRLIRDHERKMAHSLAILVMDRPNPPFWMTFVPMFLVFLTQKFRQYESDVKNFADSYLESREHAMAILSHQGGAGCDHAWSFLDKLDMPDNARCIYTKYVGMLADHYASLLQCDGCCIDELTRQAYADRSGFEIFCDALNAVESDLNFSLLPQINEEKDLLHHIVQQMNDGIARLRREEADRIFA